MASYVAVRDLFRANCPERETEFTDAFKRLHTDPEFRTIELQQVIGPRVLEDLRRLIAEVQIGALENHELFRFGRYVIHNHPYLNQMQGALTRLVSDHVGEPVEASYNFLSLYNNLGVCELHMDAPNAKWTLDLCIDQSSAWPIQISNVCDWPVELDCSSGWEARVFADRNVEFSQYTHIEGSGLLFSGSSQWHYRDRIPRSGQENFSHLAFFHFIPAGTGELADPRKWASLFGMPQIADVVVELWPTS